MKEGSNVTATKEQLRFHRTMVATRQPLMVIRFHTETTVQITLCNLRTLLFHTFIIHSIREKYVSTIFTCLASLSRFYSQALKSCNNYAENNNDDEWDKSDGIF